MKKPYKISLSDARRFVLHNQMLLGDHPAQTKRDLLKIIEKLGYIQIDTISIIERAHKHILWTRFPGYQNNLLDELIDKDKKVFEFWDHAASYIPMKYYRYSLPRKNAYAVKHKAWAKKNRKILQHITDRITAEGPLQSRDFEDPNKRGLWWDWKPAKEGLEFLFHTGVLMAKARKSFQKVYDLTEKVLPGNVDVSIPTYDELTRHLVMKEISALGFASLKEITYLRHHNRSTTLQVLNEMLEDKKIVPLEIEGIGDEKYFTTSKNLKELNKISVKNIIHILSPFDNAVIQRKRMNTLFGFDYTIECYLPAPRRKFGYFCLPVLYKDKFLGRLDAKSDRAASSFKIINFFWENSISEREKKQFIPLLNNKINELAIFTGCRKVY